MAEIYACGEAGQAEKELRLLFGKIAAAKNIEQFSKTLPDPVKEFIFTRLRGYTFPFATNHSDYLVLNFLNARLNGNGISLNTFALENRVNHEELHNTLSNVTGTISRRVAGFMRRGDIKDVPRFNGAAHVEL